MGKTDRLVKLFLYRFNIRFEAPGFRQIPDAEVQRVEAESRKGAVGRTLVTGVVYRKDLHKSYTHFYAEGAKFREIGEFPDSYAPFGS